MKPTLAELKQINNNKYNIAPVYIELLSDRYTTINVLQNLKNISKKQFLFESAFSDSWSRYSFLGFDPKLEIKCKNNKITITKDKEVEVYESNTPIDELKKITDKYKSYTIDDLPSFTGGLVGYFSYDTIKYMNKIDLSNKDLKNFDDYYFMLFEDIICFDNYKKKIYLITNCSLNDNLDNEYTKALHRLNRLKEIINLDFKAKTKENVMIENITSTITYPEYDKKLNRIKEYIKNGDIFQCVFSRNFKGKMNGSLFNTYRVLRTINPSPYMVYLDNEEIEVCSSSPETLIKKENDLIQTFPIAGSRKRGLSREEDIKLKEELLNDPKELAEHHMLLDLGRNDIGRVSEIGSVKVNNYLNVKMYSHVMHLESSVIGKINKEYSYIDCIKSILPAGTLSGAPKLRAMEIIEELEDESRGIYGGSIGYIDFKGNMDMAIAIRTVIKKKEDISIQAGGGIVLDSNNIEEYKETENKAMALIKAIEASCRRLE